jgi:hypothetical protein
LLSTQSGERASRHGSAKRPSNAVGTVKACVRDSEGTGEAAAYIVTGNDSVEQRPAIAVFFFRH